MDFIKQPMAIENRSMEIIAPYLKSLQLDEKNTKVYSLWYGNAKSPNLHQGKSDLCNQFNYQNVFHLIKKSL